MSSVDPKSGIPVMAPPAPTFTVGDKVWINGTKAGVVAFIGLTKFAAGEWVGVNLDEPQGKNDGSVGGVSYFKCKALHGVFSRASRLTREPNTELADQTIVAASSAVNSSFSTQLPPSASSTPKPAERLTSSIPKLGDKNSLDATRNRRSASPTPSEKSMTVSPTGSTTSISSVGAAPKLGDRVIVSSQIGGSKTGTLRFAGPAHFAAGEWAGVELDTPTGKNDGSVADKRYFECPANHGIFVPMSKVTKSPKNRMQKISVTVPSPAKLCRQKSDVSDRSVASTLDSSSVMSGKTPRPKLSVSSLNAPERLRASVKEKEMKIEQLIKERDLERAEVAKAAMQTDEAETQLNKLRKEYTAYKMEMDKKVCDLESAMEDKMMKLMMTSTELDDEKRKNEDLQFKLEEDEIMRSEATAAGNVEELLSKIRDLESKLAAEQKARTELVGGRSQFELQIRNLEEQLGMERKKSVTNQAGATEQLTLLAMELEKQQKLATTMTGEKERLEQRLDHLEKTLEDKANECVFLSEESQVKLTDAEEKIIKLTQDLDSLKSDLKSSSEKIGLEQKRFETVSGSLKDDLDKALEKVDQLEKSISEKERLALELEQKLDSEKQVAQSAKTMLENKISEAQASKSEWQDLKHQLASKENELEDSFRKLDNLEEKLKSMTSMSNERESTFKEVLANHSHKEKSLQREIEELRCQLDQSGAESHERWTKIAEETKKATAHMEESERRLRDKIKELSELQMELGEMSERVQAAEKTSANLQSEKEELEKRINLLRESTKTSSDEVKRLSGTLNLKDVEVESLRADLASLSDQLQELKGVITKNETENSDRIDEMKKQHKKLLAETEEKAKKLESAKEKVERSKEEAIQTLNEKIRSLMEENTETVQHLKEERSRREAEISSLNKKVDHLVKDLSDKTGSASEAYTKLNKMHQDTEAELTVKVQELQLLQSESRSLGHEVEKLRSTTKELELLKEEKETLWRQFSDLSSEMTIEKENVQSLEKDKSSLESKLKDLAEKGTSSSEALSKAQEEVELKSAEIKNLRDELSKRKLESSSFKEQLEALKVKLTEETAKLEKANSEVVTKLNADIEALKAAVGEKKAEIDSLKAQTSEKEKSHADQIDQAKKEVLSKDEQLSKVGQDLALELSNVQRLNQELKSANQQIMELQEKFETLQRTHDEEMGEMVDAVNDLREKEEELSKVLEKLDQTSSELEKSKQEVTRMEEKHQEEVNVSRDRFEKEISTLTGKLDEAQNQIRYLKESLASAKVDLDLHLEKEERERASFTDNHRAELEMKNMAIAKLKEQLADKETLLDLTREELATKTEELQDLMVDLEVKEAGFNNSFRETSECHKEEIEVLVSKVETAKKEVSDLHETVARMKTQHATNIDEMITARKQEINSLQDEISEKDRKILDIESELFEMKRQLQDSKTTSESELKLVQLKIDQIGRENEELRNQKREIDAALRKSQAENVQAVHQNEELSIRIVEKERQVREVSSQVQSMRMTYEKTQKELNERLERSTQDNTLLEETKKALEVERQRVDELQVSLGDVESERDNLLEKLSDYESVRQQLAELEERETVHVKNIDDLKIKHTFILDEFQAERHELNEVVQRSKQLLTEKIEEFKWQKNEYDKLVNENQQLNCYKRNILMLEQEKRELESRLAVISSTRRSATPDGDLGADDLKGQVDFLNSVIVDMQRKNDELKAKLDLLESAGVFEAVDINDLIMMNGVDRGQVAPRLFCDICDRFDLHDTEDCPTQSMQYEEEAAANTKSGGVRGQQRAYCEKCEVFGHDTETCTVADSY